MTLNASADDEPEPSVADAPAASFRPGPIKSRTAELSERYRGLDGAALLQSLLEGEFPKRLAVVSSFGAESAVILAQVAEIDRGTPVLFLDTGKLFSETLRYRDRLVALLGLRDVRTLVPDAERATAPEAPPIADRRFYDSERYHADPWAPDALAGLDPSDPVLLIGTGLTMIDTAISLLDRGHTGPIHALSRRGLLPRRHASTSAGAASLIERALPTTAAGLTRAIREEIAEMVFAGGDWRSVIDGLRPTTQDLWHTMPAEERARFVRHLRPWWDVHRHRIAPELADRIDKAVAAGQLIYGATRIRDIRATAEGVVVVHWLRRATADHRLVVQRVVNCSGPACDYQRITDPLIRNLLERGDIRPDPLRLGLDVSTLCALRNSRGEIWQRLYAVGPVTRPAFWEVTSVPDIRRQCETLAAYLGTRLPSAGPASGEIVSQQEGRPAEPLSAAEMPLPELGRAIGADEPYLW